MMSPPINIKKYDLTRGEKIVHGPMAGLEIIFNRLALELESCLFDQFSIPFQIDFGVEQGIKFRDFQLSLEQPHPIFIFQLAPLKGDALLVIENRFANLFFQQKELRQNKKISVTNNFLVNNNNFTLLQDSVVNILLKLQKSWDTFGSVQLALKKLVSHRMKAKVINPFETCAIVTMKFCWKQFETKLRFCFSYIFLDPILKSVSRSDLLASEGKTEIYSDITEHFRQTLQDIPYDISGVLGKIRLSRNQLIEKMNSGAILPIRREKNDYSTVFINNVPLFSCTVGSIRDNYSVQLHKACEENIETNPSKEKKFQKIQFKKLSL